MKIKIFFFGKTSEITEREQELLKRIGFRSEVELVCLPQAGLQNRIKNQQKEMELLNKKCVQKEFLVVLDEGGREMDSIEFSKNLKNWLVEQGTVCFVVGGAYGLADEILQKANIRLSFGSMTWTRELARLMTLEQIYRALEIDGGGRFHK